MALRPAASCRALTGLGMEGRLDGQGAFVGRPAPFEERAVRLDPVKWAVERFEGEGKTVVGVGKDQTLLGVLALRDRIRPGAGEAVEALHRVGVKVAMLTGDNKRTAAAIAGQVGIDHIHAGLKPEEKVRYVERMAREVAPVAMVGDGINDAPALMAATVGIALGRQAQMWPSRRLMWP